MTGTGLVERDEGAVRVVGFARDLNGRANLDQVRDFFANHFVEHLDGQHRVVIDLGGVATLDSSCLGPLVQKLKEVQEKGGRLVLAAVDSPALREIFALTRFDRVFDTYPSVTDAVASFR